MRRAGGGAVAVVGTLAALAISTTPAWAGHGGNAGGNGDNRGDAWVDAVGQGQVGHENDPHLGCNDVAIWGAMLNDASGPFTIQGWPPSGAGSGEVDWSSTWSYDTAAGGSQVIATVPVQSLIANAVAAGDTRQPQQGYHFKLDLEDPRGNAGVGDDKDKVFWVDCVTRSAVTPATTTPTPTPHGSTPTPGATPTPSGGVSGAVSTPTPTPTPAGGVLGLSTTSPSGGAGGATTPLTGAALPYELAAALGAAGLGLAAAGLRLRRR